MSKFRFVFVLAVSMFATALANAKSLPIKSIVPDPPSLCDSVAGNLLVNCGFELGLSDWTLSGNNVFTFGAPMTGVDPNSGSDYASLGDQTDGFMSQTLVTVPGQVYNISWYLEVGELGGQSAPNAFSATWDGTQIYTATDLPSTSSFTQYSFTEVATSPSTTLMFGYLNDPDFLFLDDVAVSAVPEPGYFAAAGLGLLALLFAHKRRLA
jgi:hypothetical protein